MADPETVVLITGASRGLGLATARLLATFLPTNINISSVQLDVTNPSSVEAATRQITEKFGKLDILINNAGVSPQTPSLIDNLSESISVNLLGSVRVTESLLPLLRKSSAPRLLFITSVLGSISARSDPTDPFSGFDVSGYLISKAAVNMALACYSHTLASEGFKVFGVCPGFLVTKLNGPPDMTQKMGAQEPEVAAKLLLSVISGERDADQGKVVHSGGARAW